MIPLTGLWVAKTKEGTPYMSGSVSPKIKLLVFKNRNKQKDSDPEYVAYFAAAENKSKQSDEKEANEDIPF